MKREATNKKRLIQAAIIAGVVVLLILGIWLYNRYQRSKRSVEVIPVANVSTEYWGDTTYTSGVVTKEHIQELRLEAGKIISEVFVVEGQTVSMGDPLLQYDKEPLELEVQKQTNQVDTIENNITNAQKQLRKLQNTTVSNTSAPTPTRPPVITTPKPTITNPPPSSSPSVTPGTTDNPTITPVPTPSPTPVPTADPNVILYTEILKDATPYSGDGTSGNPYRFLCTPGCKLSSDFVRQLFGLDPREDLANPGSTITAPFAAVFEVRDGNSNHGRLIHSYELNGHDFSSSIGNQETAIAGMSLQADALPKDLTQISGLRVTGTSTAPQIGLLNESGATPTPSPSVSPGPSATPEPDNYNSMGYTAAELKELIADKKAEIAELQLSLKQERINLDRANLALKNSTVLSEVDGTVKSLLSAEEATDQNLPFMTVSGGGSYYLKGTLNELFLGTVQPGDYVSANSWELGQSFECQVVSIKDYPVDNNSGYYDTATNNSEYEFLAVFDSEEGLRNDMWMEITLQSVSAESGDAIYLEKMYVREDDTGSYVMKKGPDTRIMKQYVQTGRLIYGGNYVEIKSGLTTEDEIAFPYGTAIWEGIRTRPYGTEEGEEYALSGGAAVSSDASSDVAGDDAQGEQFPAVTDDLPEAGQDVLMAESKQVSHRHHPAAPFAASSSLLIHGRSEA